MHNTKLDNRLSLIAWGIILMLFGILDLIPGNQIYIFLLGAGVVLFVVNLIRYIKKISMNRLSITLGIITIATGGLGLAISILRGPLQMELPLFPVLSITTGLYLLIPSSK